MKKLELNQMEKTEGGTFLGGLSCGIGIGLILSGGGILAGIALGAGCYDAIWG